MNGPALKQAQVEAADARLTLSRVRQMVHLQIQIAASAVNAALSSNHSVEARQAVISSERIDQTTSQASTLIESMVSEAMAVLQKGEGQ